MKLKKGDNVVVLAGRDKGKTGVIIKTLRDTNQVIVDGVQMVKKHVKGEQGGIVDMNHPIDASNVAFVDSDGKPTRLGYKVEKGTKTRIAKTNGKSVD